MKNASTSYRIVELVKTKISNEYLRASDTDAAKALGISRAAISTYRAGSSVMSHETLELAQKILRLPEAELLELFLQLSSEQSPQMKAIHAAQRIVLDVAKKAGLKVGAAMLAVMLIAGNAGKIEAATTSPSADIYIMRTMGRRSRAACRRRSIAAAVSEFLRRFCYWTPLVPVLALSGCLLNPPSERGEFFVGDTAYLISPDLRHTIAVTVVYPLANRRITELGGAVIPCYEIIVAGEHRCAEPWKMRHEPVNLDNTREQ